MDTGNDPRFVVVDRALVELKHIFEAGKIKTHVNRHKATELCQHAHGALMTLRYSYGESDQIRALPEFAQLTDFAGELEAMLGGAGFEGRIKDEALAVAQTAWTLATIRSLGRRLSWPGTGLELGVELSTGRVVSAHPHPEAADLLVTRVGAGRPHVIVTNDKTVKADDHVGVAVLPPMVLRGVISTGMFLGAGHGVLKNVRGLGDGRPDVPDAAYGETRSILGKFLGLK